MRQWRLDRLAGVGFASAAGVDAAVFHEPVGEQQQRLGGVQPVGGRLVAAEAGTQGRADRHRQQ
ncbi:hypothetical protein [Streptomyces sp. SD31]|uniref:hypothetical protein n=1 Tax=Streptomyces sp. SD31 TaxID=3452208 RepID=UPI003F8A2FCB